MIILLEGPDASGKTTLVRQEFIPRGFQYIHNGVFPSPSHAYEAYINQLKFLTPNDNVIIDRMHISERIYGRIYHGECMNDDSYWHVDSMLEKLNAIALICITNFHETLRIWASRQKDELIKDPKIFERIYDEYWQCILSNERTKAYTNLITYSYDYMNPFCIEDLLK